MILGALLAVVGLLVMGVLVSGCGSSNDSDRRGESNPESTSNLNEIQDVHAEWVREHCPGIHRLNAVRRRSIIPRAEKAIAEGKEVAASKNLVRLARRAMSKGVEDCEVELMGRRSECAYDAASKGVSIAQCRHEELEAEGIKPPPGGWKRP